MNKVFIAGHVGTDPESRFTPSGQKVTTFSVAVNIRDGKEDATVWWRVTVWGDRFDKMMPYIRKGSGVMVVGQMRPPRMYQNKEGQTQVAMEVTADSIEFSPFGRADKDQAGGQQQSRPAQQQAPQPRQSFGEQTFGAPTTGTKQQTMVEEEDPLPF